MVRWSMVRWGLEIGDIVEIHWGDWRLEAARMMLRDRHPSQ